MKGSWILSVAGFLMLAGCGQTADLKLAPGQSMPVKPLMARATPTVEQLLTPPPYARPDRVDELIKRSQPRPEDRFDLPPPSGGAAPSVPAGSDPGTVPATTTSTTTPGD
jgi:hypothetical protein